MCVFSHLISVYQSMDHDPQTSGPVVSCPGGYYIIMGNTVDWAMTRIIDHGPRARSFFFHFALEPNIKHQDLRKKEKKICSYF